ncbi:MAG: DNA translocase FtsK 4TM domain-containing protein, partial [Thiobacillaceae bacterium]|nr:DNA translocase FtsK 4TM domain-containing protein [Thiobacillaceae bacterium]
MARPTPRASQRASQRNSQPLSPRMQRLLREARALLVGFVALLLAAILASHEVTDPGFSTTGDGGPTQNLGGSSGAWLSDMLLMLFGMSAWWWVVLALAYVWHSFRHLDETPLAAGSRQRWVRFGGFALMLASSTGIEWLRLWHWPVELPDAFGGVLGAAVAGAASALLGFTGGSLLLLLLMAIGFSLFSGVSWLAIAERTGEWVERAYWKVIQTWQAYQDRKLGEVAQQKREAVLEKEKKRLVEAPPIRIE